jgi:hypothetical protein
MDTDRQAPPQHVLHLSVKNTSVALYHAAQVDAEMHQAVQTRSIFEPFALDSVQILERVDDIDGQSINMANRVAGAQQRVAVRL